MLDLLKTGKFGVLANQTLLNTTANNIANVNTEGYVRQDTQYYTSVIEWGIGESYTRRMYDQYVQRELWTDTGTVGYYEAYVTGMSNVDAVLSDSDMSIATSINDFFTALQDAIQNPSVTSTRTELLTELQDMVNRYQTLNSYMASEIKDINSRISDTVAEINDLVQSIYTVNKQINQMSDSQSEIALQLEDKRDQLIYQLSELVGISATTDADGSLSLYMQNGQLLVNGETYATLVINTDEYDSTKLNVSVTFNTSSTAEIYISNSNWGGQLGGYLESTDEIRQTMRELGQLAIAFADALNVQNSGGITLENLAGSDLITIPTAKAVSSNADYAMTVSFITGLGSNVTANDYKVIVAADGTTSVYMVEDGKDIEIDSSELVWNTYTDATTGDSYSVLTIESHGIEMTFNEDITVLQGLGERTTFYVQPTINAAYDISLAITKPEDFAFASAVRGNTGSSNQGNAVIEFEGITMTGDDYGVTIDAEGYPVFTTGAPTQIVIDADGNYEVYDSNGNLLGEAPSSCNGQNIFENTVWVNTQVDGYPGYEFSITGTVVAGDYFEIEINTDGFSDNSNGVLMGLLQQADLVYSSANNKVTFTEGYANILTNIGSAVSSANTNLAAAEAKLEQTETLFSSTAGVNLDEEAANLIRYQQCYQACSKIISTSQTIFEALIEAI